MIKNNRSTGSPAAQDAPKAPGDCSPAELHAIAIVGKDAKRWRDSLTPGSYPVDLSIRIFGTLEVGEDQHSSEKDTPDLKAVLAYTLQFLGAKTRARLAAALVDHFTAANHKPAPKEGDKPYEPRAEILGLATTVIEQCTTRALKEKRGNVTGKIAVERLMSPPKRAA